MYLDNKLIQFYCTRTASINYIYYSKIIQVGLTYLTDGKSTYNKLGKAESVFL